MRVQEWIHRLEEGGGARYLRWFVTVASFIALAALYNSFCFHNLSNPEAMEAAQLARNIGKGHGFTTLCVRPFSIKLARDHNAQRSGLLKEGHKDISTPPVYPLLLAPLAAASSRGGVATMAGSNIYKPDLLLALFNQCLLGVGAFLVFRLAFNWFNRAVAWMAMILFLLTELYWRFSVSGLSTLLLIDLVLVLVWLLARLERRGREGASQASLCGQAVLAGGLTAVLMLTHYALGWLILPVTIFVVWSVTQRRWLLGTLVVLAFVVIGSPWLIRTTLLSGFPFGTATFAPLEDTLPAFPADTLQRSLAPPFTGLPGHRWHLLRGVGYKCVSNMRDIIITEVPRLGGNWLWGFFLAGLLVRFQNVNLNRLRWFAAGALLLLIPVQAVTRTMLSAEYPIVNSENLLVIFSPLVLIFGVGLFFVLFESWELPTLLWRYGTLAAFAVLVSLPLLLAFLPPYPRTIPPPYYPPRIQQFAQYLSGPELMMSDIPWAVAWYGGRQCVWLTGNLRTELYEIDTYEKPINGLYVSTRTTDSKFLSNFLLGENQNWSAFILQCFIRREIPDGFPLKYSPENLFSNGELLLMDRDRWSAPAEGQKSR